ncbi:hypothetical protein N7532_012068 [Penicillium argentinense]|uniref:HTH APSES-type domain-containing protein n=1 Tax=Penicillium argentinense TaxID=1131581 RepID=A0A9W9JVJ0_9EURO|nr:uncharacterized protein N7532_012068 [Penicillium argentinense]KAJ5083025.1 hypothetical protein N7532_012068 [Penicillium argentinense]
MRAGYPIYMVPERVPWTVNPLGLQALGTYVCGSETGEASKLRDTGFILAHPGVPPPPGASMAEIDDSMYTAWRHTYSPYPTLRYTPPAAAVLILFLPLTIPSTTHLVSHSIDIWLHRDRDPLARANTDCAYPRKAQVKPEDKEEGGDIKLRPCLAEKSGVILKASGKRHLFHSICLLPPKTPALGSVSFSIESSLLPTLVEDPSFMASIQSLLNPLPDLAVRTPGFGAPFNLPTMRAPKPSGPGRHRDPGKQKKPKDAPIFSEADPVGEVRYPPCEEVTDKIAEEHRKCQLYPMGEIEKISDFPRHIPYKSDKKTFEKRTGRDRLEVYQYKFQYGSGGEEWVMMWDYNIGLVRITHLFKALGFSKTTPAKVLHQNPGLREICHSITGGSIAAQGYWMPFEAAKALASRFCYPIRYALTPLFGADFPDLCLKKGDENFNNMTLEPSVIQKATSMARYYRSLEPDEDEVAGTDSISQASSNPFDRRAEVPVPPEFSDDDKHRGCKWARRSYADSISSARGSSSEPYCVSPSSPPSNGFTPVNVPRSCEDAPRSHGPCIRPLPFEAGVVSSSTQSIASRAQRISVLGRRMELATEDGTVGTASGHSETDYSSEYTENDSDDEGDEDYHEPESQVSTESESAAGNDHPKKNNRSRPVKARIDDSMPAPSGFAQQVKAAHTLLRLHMQEATAADNDRDEEMSDGIVLNPLLPFRSLDESSGERKRRRASL